MKTTATDSTSTSDFDQNSSRTNSFQILGSGTIHTQDTRRCSGCWLTFLPMTSQSRFEVNLFSLQSNLTYGLIDRDERNEEFAGESLIDIDEIIDEDIQAKFDNTSFEYFPDRTPSLDNSVLTREKEVSSLVEPLNIDKKTKCRLFYSFLCPAHENPIWSTTRSSQVCRLYGYQKRSIDSSLSDIKQFIPRLNSSLENSLAHLQQSIRCIRRQLLASTRQIVLVEKDFS